MRVLAISTADWKGGSARVAHYLTAGLRARGIEADLFVRDQATEAHFVHKLPLVSLPKDSLRWKALWRLGYGHLNLGTRLTPAFAASGELDRYDVIHVHDMPPFSLWEACRRLRRPLVWTVHSMQPLTGNCIYAYDCDRWTRSCGACPQFGTWPLIYQARDASAEILRMKRALYRRMTFQAVGVSRWITDQIAQSVMASDIPPRTVQNPSWAPDYHPTDRKAARARLGVPEVAFAILFAVSGTLADTRKGLDIVVEAVQRLRATLPEAAKVFLLPTGIVAPSDAMRAMLDAFPGLLPRHLESPADLRDYYTAADVVWHPSRADTSSMVSLEAFGCGTPVIAARVGGVPEIVEHERSGLLIPPNDPEALVQATRRLIELPELCTALRDGALAKAAEHSPDRFTGAYLDLYGEAIARDHHPRS